MNHFKNHLSNKRNSRLDSFIQKNLGYYGYVRYYEQCVIESKGNFLHCHLILTDEHLLVTQNPPKTLILSIQLSDIHNIRLVAERHSVVNASGPNVFTSQHVHILSHKRPDPLTLTSGSSKLTPAFQQPSSKTRRGGTFDLPLSIQLGYLPCQPTKATTIQPTVELHSEMPSLVINGRNGDDESDSSDSFNSVDISSNGESRSSVGVGIPHRASSVLEQNLTSWRATPTNENENLNGTTTEKRRPSSVDLGARPLTSRRGFLRKYFRVGKLGPVEPKLGWVPRDSAPIKPEFDETHVHLYQSNSIFLNELFLYWNRQILKRTCQLDLFSRVTEEKKSLTRIQDGAEEQEQFMDAVQKMTETISAEILQVRHTRAKFYLLLCQLHEELRRDLPLQRLCFQNSKLTLSLLSILENTIEWTKESSNGSRNWKYLTEMLSIQMVLLDIFRMLIQTNTGTGVWRNGTSFSGKGNITNWNVIMKTLVNLTALEEESFGKEIQGLLSDPLKFWKQEWGILPEASVIFLLAIKFNISVSLLYEITSLFLYTPGDYQLPALLSKIQTEPFLRQIVTQVFNLILGGESEMTSSQAVTLYHQVSVLRILMNNSPPSFATNSLRQNFYEEFKYFVNVEKLRQRIPAEYPIQAKVISVFNTIRTEILKSPKS